MEQFKSISLMIIYALMFAITIFCVLSVLLISFSDRPNNLSTVLTAGLFSITFGGVTIYIKRVISRANERQMENIALKVAMSHDGLVTASEIAANSPFRLKQAEKFLEKCYDEKLCEKKFTEDNLVEVYFFKSAVTVESKKKSKHILDIEI